MTGPTGWLRRRSAMILAASLAAAVPTVARAQTVVNFWDMIWGPPEYIDSARKLVDQFNTSHSSIQVKYRSVSWSNWYQTFVTAIGAGTAPDISTGAGYQAVQLYDQGAIRPLDDFVADLKASGQLDDFMPGTIERLRYDNHYVALPWGIDIRVWFARKDILDAAKIPAPATWDDLRSAAKKLTTAGRYGVVGSGDTGGSQYLYSLILNNGGGLFTPEGTLQVAAPRNVEALTFLSDLVHDGSVNPASVGYDSDSRRRALLQGEAVFALDQPGLVGVAPPALRSSLMMLPPMAGPHGDHGTIAWVNNIMVYQQTKVPAETLVFLKWWSQNQKALWTEGHSDQIPVRHSIANDPYFQDDPVRRAVIDSYLPIGKGTGHFAPGIFPSLNALEGDGVMQSLTQEILQGKEVGPALARAETKLKSIVSQ